MPRQARPDDRRGPVVRGRKLFCQVAVRKLGYTGASVARLPLHPHRGLPNTTATEGRPYKFFFAGSELS